MKFDDQRIAKMDDGEADPKKWAVWKPALREIFKAAGRMNDK